MASAVARRAVRSLCDDPGRNRRRVALSAPHALWPRQLSAVAGRRRAGRLARQPDRLAARDPALRRVEEFRLQYDHFPRSEEHTSELQSLMRISYAVFCLKKKNNHINMTQHAKHKQQKH